MSLRVFPDAKNLAPSPAWARAMPPGPDARVKVTEPYARMVARDAYFWAWPMINIYNKRLGFGKASNRACWTAFCLSRPSTG